MPGRLHNSHQKLAIDLNLIPYYATPSQEEEPYIIRSKAKAGTCSFYAYATAYVISRGKRVTLLSGGTKHWSASSHACWIRSLSCISPSSVCIWIEASTVCLLSVGYHACDCAWEAGRYPCIGRTEADLQDAIYHA